MELIGGAGLIYDYGIVWLDIYTGEDPYTIYALAAGEDIPYIYLTCMRLLPYYNTTLPPLKKSDGRR